MYSESEGSKAKPLEGRDNPEVVWPMRVRKPLTIKSSTARSPRYAVYKCGPNAPRSGVELRGSRRGEWVPERGSQPSHFFYFFEKGIDKCRELCYNVFRKKQGGHWDERDALLQKHGNGWDDHESKCCGDVARSGRRGWRFHLVVWCLDKARADGVIREGISPLF